MKYDFKFVEEIGWAGGIAALTFLLTAFVAAEGVTDWRTWLITVLIGAARAAAGAALAYVVPKPGKASTPPQTGANTPSQTQP